MCVVSFISDYGRDMWPGLLPGLPGTPFSPGMPLVPAMPPIDVKPWHGPMPPPKAPKSPTQEEIDAFLDLIKVGQEFDKIAKQPDCEDPDKAKIIAELERLREVKTVDDRVAKQRDDLAGQLMQARAEIAKLQQDVADRTRERDEANALVETLNKAVIEQGDQIEKLSDALSAAAQREEGFADMLYGSSNLPSHVTIDGEQVQLGTIVLRAFKATGLSAEDWNDLPSRDREHFLIDTIEDMRETAAATVTPLHILGQEEPVEFARGAEPRRIDLSRIVLGGQGERGRMIDLSRGLAPDGVYGDEGLPK